MERLALLKPSRFGNAEKRRILDTEKLREKRSLRRTTKFNLQRGLISDENDHIIENVPPKEKKVIDRKLALQKFKAEKEAKKKALQNQKKPPFIVGIPRHGSSPLCRNSTLQDPVKKEIKNPASEFSFQPKLPQSEKKLTSPHTPTVLKRSVQKKPLKVVSNLVSKQKNKPADSKPCDIEEVLAAPLYSSMEDDTATVEVEENITDDRTEDPPKESSETVEHLLPNSSNAETELNHEVAQDGKDNELIKEVAFQHGRLQQETERLLELAEKWQTTMLRETAPQEVVDEVDSLVGQTRLLTSDKFQQFRRLVDQYERKTGSHVITLDDLNGFWDMVYLQVESLDKRYSALDCLKNNNWAKAEPARKKKRQPAKAKVKKVTESVSENQGILLQLEDQLIRTPSTSARPVISSVLMHRKRTRSNSPSPYIAMRLSGICKTPTTAIKPTSPDVMPKIEIVSPECPGTPKSAVKNDWKKLTESTKKKRRSLLTSPTITKIDPDEEIEKQPDEVAEAVPVFTPRRSMRLMSKMSTPASCATCETSCKKSDCPARIGSRRVSRTPKRITPVKELESNSDGSSPADTSSAKLSQTKKVLMFLSNESEPKESSAPDTDLFNAEEKNKPTTSRVRFSLRPSVLANSLNILGEMSNKVAKHRKTSVFFAKPEMENEHESELSRRRSTRQSKKVTFESEVDSNSTFKHPATPYRKARTDS